MQAISLIVAWLQWTWPDLFDGWTKLLEFEFEWRELNVGNNVKYVTCSKNRIQYLSIKYVFFWALTESWTFPYNQSEINSNLLFGPTVSERNSVKVDGTEKSEQPKKNNWIVSMKKPERINLSKLNGVGISYVTKRTAQFHSKRPFSFIIRPFGLFQIYDPVSLGDHFFYRSLLDSRTVYIHGTFAIMHMHRSILAMTVHD